jgi:hypothetical protein
MQSAETVLGVLRERGKRNLPRGGGPSWQRNGARRSSSASRATRPSMQTLSRTRHKPLESLMNSVKGQSRT